MNLLLIPYFANIAILVPVAFGSLTGYTQDPHDGRLTTQRMHAVVPSDKYPTAVGNRAEITYAGDDTVFGNPERGWFVFGELKPHGNNINSWATDELLKNYYAQGYRLAKHILIIPTRAGPI